MKILKTSLLGDILKVVDFNGTANTNVHLSMELNIPNVGNIKVPKIHNMVTLRDYRVNRFDTTTAIIEVPVSDYQARIYPNKSILTANLFVTEASTTGVHSGSTAKVRNYTVLLLTNEDHELFDQTYSGNNETEKDNNVIPIQIQLIETEIYVSKDIEYSGVFDTGVIEDYLLYFMSNRGKIRCSIHPPDNMDDMEDVMLKEGIELINVPSWLQNEVPGIYNHGINTYYQRGTMYVFPISLLTTHPYRRRMMLYRMGSDVGLGTGNTYAVIDGVLHVLSSGDITPDDESTTRTTDERDTLEQIYGNAVRWNDPRYQSDVIDETNDAMRYTSKGSHLHGLTDVPLKIEKVHNAHTVNSFKQRSIINKTLGRVITIPWNSGDIDLIEPGTEVTYHYMKGESVEAVSGIIDGTMEHLTLSDDNPLSSVFSVQSVLRIRVM